MPSCINKSVSRPSPFIIKTLLGTTSAIRWLFSLLASITFTRMLFGKYWQARIAIRLPPIIITFFTSGSFFPASKRTSSIWDRVVVKNTMSPDSIRSVPRGIIVSFFRLIATIWYSFCSFSNSANTRFTKRELSRTLTPIRIKAPPNSSQYWRVHGRRTAVTISLAANISG